MIRAVLFDVIGTTVLEKDPDVINRCFHRSFLDQGVTVKMAEIIARRGKDKREAIQEILHAQDKSSTLTQAILDSFRKNFSSSISSFKENSGTAMIFQYLKNAGVKIGIGSGLPKDLFYAIYDHLHWNSHSFDFIGIAEDIGKGRPHPDMILRMLRDLNVDRSEFLKVGDTVADIEEGKNAKVLTAAIFSGTQPKERLQACGPDFLISSLMEIKTIIG